MTAGLNLMEVCESLYAVNGRKLNEVVLLYRRLLMHKTFAGALSRGLGWNRTSEALQESHGEERWSFQGTSVSLNK